MTVCAVKGCHNASDKKDKHSKITFHTFPTEPTIAAQWIEKIRLNRHESWWKPSKWTKLCSLHFNDSEKYTTKGGLCRLRRNTVPTKNLHIFCNDSGNGEMRKDCHELKELQPMSEQEAQPGPSKILDTRTPLIGSGGKERDPLITVTAQCRFCGEFSKYCVVVSSDMTYLAGNKTALAMNNTSVQLEFNDGSLPKTVCRDCDAKLQEFCDFVQVVKAAQGTLINVAEEKEEFEPEFKETTADVEENAEYEETEIITVKTEYDSQEEDSNDDKEGIVDSFTIGETVFVKETHKRKSDTDTAKPKKLKAKEKCEDDLLIDIKEEVVEKDANDGHELSEVSDTGTDVQPCEFDLPTSALVFEMAVDGTCEYQGYRSDR